MRKTRFAILSMILFCINTFAGGSYFKNIESLGLDAKVAEKSINSILNVGGEFKLVNTEVDNLGISHHIYQQYSQGVKIDGMQVIIHENKNKIAYLINGQAATEDDLKQLGTNFRSSKDSTVVIIKNDKGEYCFAKKEITNEYIIYRDTKTNEIIKKISTVCNYSNVTNSVQTFYSGTQNINTRYYEDDNKFYLVDNKRRIIGIDATNTPPDNWDYTSPYASPYSDFTKDLEYLASITITNTPNDDWWYSIFDSNPDFFIEVRDLYGRTYYISETRSNGTFPITFTLPNIYLSSNFLIYLYDENTISDNVLGDIIEIPSNNGNTTYYFNTSKTIGYVNKNIRKASNPLVDAYWGMEKSYDYFFEKFGRIGAANSIELSHFIAFNPPNEFGSFSSENAAFFRFPFDENAFEYNGTKCGLFYFGAGSSEYGPFAALDLVAHEFTHMVTHCNHFPYDAGLVYEGESGALNESFSDIFASNVENYLGRLDWEMGEDITYYAPYLRSLKDPKSKEHPNTYKGDYWVNTSSDNGGVHTNSGVQNYWYYLVCEGGSGTNDFSYSYNINGIGIDKGEQIAYRNLIYYLTPNATYADACKGSIQATIDLYGTGTELQTVKEAWRAVGLNSAVNETENRYEINIVTDGEGVVETNTTSATSGSFVEITITPQDGFFQKSLTITKDDIEIAQDTRWFQMPEGNVTIHVVFEKIATDATETVQNKQVENSGIYSIDGKLIDKNPANTEMLENGYYIINGEKKLINNK